MGIRSAMQVTSTGGAGGGANGGGTSGVFVTPQSLTFPGSAVLVSFLLKLASVPFRHADTSFWWALGISFVVGVIIYMFSLNETMSGSDKAKAAIVAILNILVLAGTALGVGSLVSNDPVST